MSSMLFFIVSCISFLLFTSKLQLPVKPLPSWVHELRVVLLLFCSELAELTVDWLRNWRVLRVKAIRDLIFSQMAAKKKCVPVIVVEEFEETDETNLLDLPGLPLDCILEKLSPQGLSRMACVCRTLRDMCREDHLWERHLSQKWGKLCSGAGFRQWETIVIDKNKDSNSSSRASVDERLEPKGWMKFMSCIWPLNWFKTKFDDDGSRTVRPLRVESIMTLYSALESGKFWFPAQVYNRENGHVGFMLSCYDAEVIYDCTRDTFYARYPPHGKRPAKVEEGITWDRLRAPPVDTPPNIRHVSNCLEKLRPGDHIEIQWRKSKEFPYGWWYGVVGHLDSCDGTSHYCNCHKNDTIMIEFNHYAPGSRWRKALIGRKDIDREDNEAEGFYGGIRKLCSKEEISQWRQLWPTQVLE